ncbi:M48 family metallopeptidase [Candidatus Saccharibacteria bacterium TM7i]|nr:M48 family metallopeptidase [Candidatus Saccharibacteria bacterium TM7i]
MPSIHDEEFGTITVRRSPKSRQVRIRVAPNGTLRASMPPYTPLIFLKRLLKSSRDELREMIQSSLPQTEYYDGQQIGKRHTLLVRQGLKPSVTKRGQTIVAVITGEQSLRSPEIIKSLREMVIKVLKSEAKDYLPKRLEQIAKEMDCAYERVRFSHASSRWGSCSSTGTISLNIALMKLPFHLIDYVIIHELAHTKEMNHSSDFWSIVGQFDAHYKVHRKEMADETPSI